MREKKKVHVFFFYPIVQNAFRMNNIMLFIVLFIYLFICCGGVLQSTEPECHVSSLTRFGSELLSEVGGGPG